MRLIRPSEFGLEAISDLEMKTTGVLAAWTACLWRWAS